MIYRFLDNDYEVEIIRKGNKNTYVRITDDLKIQVTTNHFVTKNDIKKILDNNHSFLKKALSKKESEIEKNESFYFLGIEYGVVIVSSFKEIEIDHNKIYAPDKKTLDKWLTKQMKEIFLDRLKYNYNLFEEDIPFPGLKIRSMKTRWGVCNRRNKTVTLNSALIKESMDKIDYVIIHELSHLVHFDHSKAFWGVVSKYCPNYKSIRKEMRE